MHGMLNWIAGPDPVLHDWIVPSLEVRQRATGSAFTERPDWCGDHRLVAHGVRTWFVRYRPAQTRLDRPTMATQGVSVSR